MKRTRINALSAALIVGLLSFPLGAAELRWSDRTYSFFLSGEPLASILTELGSREGIPVKVDSAITARVNAQFVDESADTVFERLIGTYNLQWYYDGHVLHVDDIGSTASRTIQLSAVAVSSFRDHLKALGVFDDRFYWGGSEREGVVVVSGPQGYVDRVAELAVLLERRNAGYDVFYKWEDSQGLTHYSSSPGDAPEDAKVMRVARDSKDAARPVIEMARGEAEP